MFEGLASLVATALVGSLPLGEMQASNLVLLSTVPNEAAGLVTERSPDTLHNVCLCHHMWDHCMAGSWPLE